MTLTTHGNPLYVFFDNLLYVLFYWVDLFHASRWGWALVMLGIELVVFVIIGLVASGIIRLILRRRKTT
ncbi:MAG: hypothetical protein JWM37_101 [Candidatus Saccharibacteria bacterium]|nr:hypothetical protein [Candidatus Saccharibacteria bacterium]